MTSEPLLDALLITISNAIFYACIVLLTENVLNGDPKVEEL